MSEQRTAMYYVAMQLENIERDLREYEMFGLAQEVYDIAAKVRRTANVQEAVSGGIASPGTGVTAAVEPEVADAFIANCIEYELWHKSFP